MLLSYKFSNFQSFLDETTVSFVLNQITAARGWERMSPSGERASTALAIFGATAAGKTALLKPLAFAAWFIADSFASPPDAPIPVAPHATAPDQPTQISIEADDQAGVRWRYELATLNQKVTHEALYKKASHQSRFSYVFVRDLDPSGRSYVVKQRGFGLAPAEAKKVRPNASLISTALQYGTDLAQHVAGFEIITNVNFLGRNTTHIRRTNFASDFFGKNVHLRPKMVNLLRSWDLGLDDVELEERDLPKKDGSLQKVWITFGCHRTSEGQTFKLPMELESSGTQSAYVLLSDLLYILEVGGVAVIDEMESDLHPMLLEPILELFDREDTNPHKSQIIFTSHSTKILESLQKAQVMFVEKTDCESEAFRGDSVQNLRSDDNLRAKYETGAIGATPKL